MTLLAFCNIPFKRRQVFWYNKAMLLLVLLLFSEIAGALGLLDTIC